LEIIANGENSGVEFKRDGPLVGRFTRQQGGGRGLIERGLIEDLMDRLQGQPLVSIEANNLADGLRRQRIWHYPPAALREAFVNALAHRDWTRPLEVEIVAYSDRLEVVSPGALQNSMTVEKMLAGQRSPRNTIIVGVLRDYGYVDAVPAHVTIHTDARRRSIQLDNLVIEFKPTAPSRLYWAGRPAMRVVQALHWLKDTMPSDKSRILGRLAKVLDDPNEGDAIRQDLLSGFSALPTWMQSIVRELPGCDPQLSTAKVHGTSEPLPVLDKQPPHASRPKPAKEIA
jgi:hypothetical protein